ncbi:PAAR domain-containing protein [Oxalobacteraceae sp. CFBP 8753]|nr:PAAR domain-containing protein [Oxalobacteraceae sp. CFBP 8753]
MRSCLNVRPDPGCSRLFPAVTINGVPVAFDGHATSCGACLMSTATDSGRD